MDKDNKYDQSFRTSELGIKRENEKTEDDRADEERESDLQETKEADEHFAPSEGSDDFGGGRGWE